MEAQALSRGLSTAFIAGDPGDTGRASTPALTLVLDAR